MSAGAAEAAVEVGDLDPAGLLALAAVNEREIRAREALRLELAYQWAVLHPATPDTGVATPGGPALDVLAGAESLGGPGTPAVAAFAPEPFALALGMTPTSGAGLIGDALDLTHRLPLLWKRVQALRVPAWQARRVAQQTRRLPSDGVRWVDQQLAARPGGGCGPVIVDRLVAHAVAEFDPSAREDREQTAETGWDVSLSEDPPTEQTGTSHLTADGDTPTLRDFHALVCHTAHQLHLDGDTSPLGVRKIKAIAIITRAARGQQSLPAATGRGPKLVVYAHLDAADLDTAPDDPALTVARVEKLGPVSLAKLRAWAGHHQVVIRPVLNMQRGDSVDVHDPPAWMRDLVILRDGHCVFPHCTTDARSCDLDHTVPYDPDGPPGQTQPDNLATLCRRHHRAKTAGAWRYWRTPEGDFHWHGPHGASYLVTPRATTKLPRP